VERGAAVLRGSESGNGPSVVLIHAGVADRRSWFEVMDQLSGQGVRCLAYDQRGYGDTTYDTEPYSAREDLLAVLAGRGLSRAVLVGCSRGGQIALDVAVTMPEVVDALMLIGSAPSDAPFPTSPPEVTELAAAVEKAEAAGDLAAVNELEARIWLDGPMAPPGRVGSPARDLFLDMNGRALAAPDAGEMEPFAPTWEELPRLGMPVSLLVGELDLPELRAAAEAVAARIPGAEFQLMPETAHLPMVEQPAATAEAIRTLLARL